jgi:hypothetical protein
MNPLFVPDSLHVRDTSSVQGSIECKSRQCGGGLLQSSFRRFEQRGPKRARLQHQAHNPEPGKGEQYEERAGWQHSHQAGHAARRGTVVVPGGKFMPVLGCSGVELANAHHGYSQTDQQHSEDCAGFRRHTRQHGTPRRTKIDVLRRSHCPLPLVGQREKQVVLLVHPSLQASCHGRTQFREGTA